MYANPYNICVKCRKQTTDGILVDDKFINIPCGHNADFKSICPSWSPVDGCECLVECMEPEHVSGTAFVAASRD